MLKSLRRGRGGESGFGASERRNDEVPDLRGQVFSAFLRAACESEIRFPADDADAPFFLFFNSSSSEMGRTTLCHRNAKQSMMVAHACMRGFFNHPNETWFCMSGRVSLYVELAWVA